MSGMVSALKLVQYGPLRCCGRILFLILCQHSFCFESYSCFPISYTHKTGQNCLNSADRCVKVFSFFFPCRKRNYQGTIGSVCENRFIALLHNSACLLALPDMSLQSHNLYLIVLFTLVMVVLKSKIYICVFSLRFLYGKKIKYL